MTDINNNSFDLSQDEDESKENEQIDYQNIFNYKGYFVDEANEDEEELKFFEHGAHFPYSFLYHRLELLLEEQKKNEYDNNKQKAIINRKQEDEVGLNNNISALFNHNEHSRNRNCNNNQTSKGTSKECRKVKPKNVLCHIPMGNQIETKTNMNLKTLPKTKTDYKSILYSIVTSKLKMNKYLNFSKGKIVNKGNFVIMKTVQYSNSTYNNNSGKNKELSILSNKDTSMNMNKAKAIKSNNANYKSIPKTLINIIANYKTKPRIYYSPSTKNHKAKELKAQIKKILASQYKTQKPKGYEINNSKKQLTISLDKKQKKKDFDHNIFDNRKSRCQTNSNNKTCNMGQNKKHKFNLRLKNIQDILLSISKTNTHLSRNPQFDVTSISKSKTSNQNYRESNITQENNIENNTNAFNPLSNNQLQTTGNIMKRKSKAKASKVTMNKMSSHFNMKYSLNPKIKVDLMNIKDKSISLSSLLVKTKAEVRVNTKHQENNPKRKVKDVNTRKKEGTNYPGSSSFITTNKQSISGQKPTNVTNSKTSLMSNNAIKSYLNSFNKCNKSPKY